MARFHSFFLMCNTCVASELGDTLPHLTASCGSVFIADSTTSCLSVTHWSQVIEYFVDVIFKVTSKGFDAVLISHFVYLEVHLIVFHDMF